jgi:hypothetical protein
MNNRNRLLIFVIVFFILSGVLVYSSSVQISQSQAQSLNQQVQSIKVTTFGIYQNNLLIALFEFVPVLGPAFAVYTTYNTGLVASASAQMANDSVTGPEATIVTMLTPIFWLEFFCYSLAVEESIVIVITGVQSLRSGFSGKRQWRWPEWRWLAGSIIAVVVILLVSAQIEVQLVHFL